MPTRPRFARLFVALALVASAATLARAAAPTPPDAARVKEIAAMLPAQPRGVGPTIEDREAWKTVAALGDAKGLIRRAESEMSRPTPELPDELYLEFTKTGNRSHYQNVAGKRRGRLAYLVLAECIENQGRFLPAIEETIRAVCTQKSWTLPAHDRSLSNFNGTELDVDLWVADIAWTMGTIDYWLGQRLSPEVRKLLRSEVRRRAFDPYESYINRGKPRMWWVTGTNNWNAVCSAGMVGAAMALIDSPEQRAWYIAAAENSIGYFLSGFTPDGYCSEGLGYWNYGFGNYTTLAETVALATGGKLDWFADPKIREIAMFGTRMEIEDGVYPAFADCSTHARPDLRLVAFLSRRLGLGMTDVERQGLLLAPGIDTSLFDFGLFGFANSATGTPPVAEKDAARPLRAWFDTAGILICRPPADRTDALGVAMKGGNNAEHHNHNDVGSFVVALNGQTPLLDPGGETYTARTFSSRRYDSGVLNSWGHPVPRVAGQLQKTGRTAAAKVLRNDFTDQQDTLVLDLTAAYPVKGLKKLHRTFVYSRAGHGSLTVTDQVEFDSPQAFGTALITYSKWSHTPQGNLRVGSKETTVDVQLSAEGGKLVVTDEEINEDCHGHHPTRLGIDLAEPVRKATITMTIRPAAK